MKTQHHRKPKWFGGTWDKWNLLTCDEKKHAAFHYFFQVSVSGVGNRPMTPEEMGVELEKWIDPAFKVNIVRR